MDNSICGECHVSLTEIYPTVKHGDLIEIDIFSYGFGFHCQSCGRPSKLFSVLSPNLGLRLPYTLLDCSVLHFNKLLQ